MKKLLVAVSLLICNFCNLAYCQGDNPWTSCTKEEVTESFKVFSNKLQKTDCTRYTAKYLTYTNDALSVPDETMLSRVFKHKDNFLVSLGDITTIYEKDLSIIVDSLESRIILSKPTGGILEPTKQIESIKEFMSNAGEIRLMKMANKINCYSIQTNEIPGLSELWVAFDNDGLCTFIRLFFDGNQSSHFENQLGYSIKVLEIQFSDFKFDCKFNNELLNPDYYIVRGTGKWTQSNRYNSFQYIDTRL